MSPSGVQPRALRRHRRPIAAALGLLALLALPAAAAAHPLGNFTINHYAGIRVEPDRIVLDVVIDQAEIPTFQEKLRIDTDGDGLVSDPEAEAERIGACPMLAGSLSLAANGRALALVPVEAGLSFPPGAAGLETMRLVCVYTAALPFPLAAGTSLAFSDGSHAERIGWREIVATGSGVTVAGSLPTTTISDRLTAYPKDLLAQPLDVRSASIAASPGGPTLAPLVVLEASLLPGAAPPYGTETGSSKAGSEAGVDATTLAAAVPGGVGAEISGLLETRNLTPLVLLISFATAMALGAGHALTPGHGKTLMGAYLVGTRGTPIHAVALGLSVTVSHTLGILALAAIVVGFRGIVSPETFNRIAPVVSGVLVVTIGGWLVVSQVRKRRGIRHGHPHADAHQHPHADAHQHPHADAHQHPHADAPIGWRSLFVLGLAGGIIPSTNALIILLSTVATGRAVFGLVLVVAFGLGMALVLGGIGLALVLARDRIERLPTRSSLGRAAAFAPLVAGVLVFSLGIWLTSQAVGGSPTL